MLRALLALAFVFAPGLVVAAEPLDWAFPVVDPVPPPASPDDGMLKQMPGSALRLTQAQIDDLANPPDWYPDDHPPLPAVVAHGAAGVRACSTCHLPTGYGHPESADLASLPAAYIERQIADFASGARKGKGSDNMVAAAKAMTADDIKQSAAFFAMIRPIAWTRVRESESVPQTYVARGSMRLPLPAGGSEPLGGRIIELPEDPARTLARDGHSGFVAYVPRGSIAAGEVLAARGGGKTLPCAACHGADLRGAGEVPRLAGRSPIYLLRQLYNIQNGQRDTPEALPMREVVRQLTIDDMIALAAYVASRAP